MEAEGHDKETYEHSIFRHARRLSANPAADDLPSVRNEDLRNKDLRNEELRKEDLRKEDLRKEGLRSEDLRNEEWDILLQTPLATVSTIQNALSISKPLKSKCGFSEGTGKQVQFAFLDGLKKAALVAWLD